MSPLTNRDSYAHCAGPPQSSNLNHSLNNAFKTTSTNPRLPCHPHLPGAGHEQAHSRCPPHSHLALARPGGRGACCSHGAGLWAPVRGRMARALVRVNTDICITLFACDFLPHTHSLIHLLSHLSTHPSSHSLTHVCSACSACSACRACRACRACSAHSPHSAYSAYNTQNAYNVCTTQLTLLRTACLEPRISSRGSWPCV